MSGLIDQLRATENNIDGKRRTVLINPNGPEAVNTIKALEKRNAELTKVLMRV